MMMLQACARVYREPGGGRVVLTGHSPDRHELLSQTHSVKDSYLKDCTHDTPVQVAVALEVLVHFCGDLYVY